MFVTPLRGRVRFVAHAVREIRNRLPDTFSGSKSGGNLQYKNRLDALTGVWTRAGLSVDGSLPHVALGGSSTAPPEGGELPIDRRVLIEVAGLVKDHVASRERPEDAAVRLFEAIAPENRVLRETLRPVIQQWLDVTNWFVARAHDSGRTDAEHDEEELRAKFELFEAVLAALVRGFFSTVKELDDILEDTNA